MRGKLGISAIVATVMIILVTVVAVSIIWMVIIPMIQEKVSFDELSGRVSIVSSEGYTVYDADEEVAIVQVKRDVDDGVMDRIRIIFSIEGSSVSFGVVAPESGGTKTYDFGLSKYGVPDSISVAPIFVSDSGSEKEGVVISDVEIVKNAISEVPVITYDTEGDYYGDYSKLPVTGLVSWWRFDGDFNDSVGENHGTENNGASIDNGELVLDGDNDYVDMGDSESLNSVFGKTTVFSISSWIKPNDWVSYGAIAKASGGSWSHTTNGLWVYSSGFRCVMGDANTSHSNGAGNYIGTSSYKSSLDEWHHVSCVGDGVNLQLYVDGVARGSPVAISGITSTRLDTSTPMVIGRRTAGSSGAISGRVDDVMIYDRALSVEELGDIFKYQGLRNGV